MKLHQLGKDTLCVPGRKVYRVFITIGGNQPAECTVYPGDPNALVNRFVRISERGLATNSKAWSAR